MLVIVRKQLLIPCCFLKGTFFLCVCGSLPPTPRVLPRIPISYLLPFFIFYNFYRAGSLSVGVEKTTPGAVAHSGGHRGDVIIESSETLTGGKSGQVESSNPLLLKEYRDNTLLRVGSRRR
jgi:hypothetical protein